MRAVRDYLAEVQEKYKTGIAREHAYRPALQKLLEAAGEGINAVNDAARSKIGMPDFVVMSKSENAPIGIVEAKDIGEQLNRAEKSAQLRRYMAHGNVILTNYLEFRWYVNGEKRKTVRIAKESSGKITRISKAYADLADMLRRFAAEAGPSINSARELARRLASIAREIAYYIEKDLNSETPDSNLLKQKDAFEETLLPDLSHADFADMYAQTFAYGLFAARVNHMGDPAQFDLRGAAEDIPQTNPFLRKLFHHSSFDLGSRLDWMMESLVSALRRTDMDDILADFGRRTQQTDPVVHFYETFLGAYNPDLREQRGVYYTPEPVVKYIVRGVDHILKSKFQRPRGLADENTLILDPAVGTGTFLYFVIECIKEALIGQRGAWKSYVQRHLLTRLFGFELLMAPYTVAHMNLSLQLKEADYEFRAGERLGIYLTNSLEEATKEKYKTPFAPFIEEEANQASEIKRDKPIMVVLGNPPYSYDSANKGAWISKLIRDYYFVDGKPLGERNPKGLQDDYVKFIRFGQWRIERTGCGVLAFITNHGYLDNVTFRGMRQSLLKTFTDIYIVNLHGDTRKSATTLEGNKDENIFDIMQGVAIIFLVKLESSEGTNMIHYCDLMGRRSHKHKFLNLNDLKSTQWKQIKPSPPYYLFKPVDLKHEVAYHKYIAVTQVFNERSMAITIQKELVNFSNNGLDSIQYRTFDERYIDYSLAKISRPRYEIMQHLHKLDNIALVTLRRPRNELTGNFWVTNDITDKSVISSKDNAYVFPLYLYQEPQNDVPNLRKNQPRMMDAKETDYFEFDEQGRRPNLSQAFVRQMEAKLGLPFITEGSAFVEDDAAEHFGPEDVFYYAYAIFHSPAYRQRYAEFLRIDFPRLPLTSDVGLFGALVQFGAELVSLHLMKSPRLSKYKTTYDVKGDDVIARGYPKYDEKNERVHINKQQYFGGVPPAVWEFHIGGYQTLHKWLKDRRGRKLPYGDSKHYQQMVVALAETIRIMAAIDAAIPQFPID